MKRLRMSATVAALLLALAAVGAFAQENESEQGVWIKATGWVQVEDGMTWMRIYEATDKAGNDLAEARDMSVKVVGSNAAEVAKLAGDFVEAEGTAAGDEKAAEFNVASFEKATVPEGAPKAAPTRKAGRDDRPEPRMPTITTLPEWPGVPDSAEGLSEEDKDTLLQTLINNKVSTYPAQSSRGRRVGKFTSTGIFDAWPPTEEQIARIAPHYDSLLFGAKRKDLVPRFKKYNPELTVAIYVDSGINPTFHQSDAGGVDEENIEWIKQHHPDWLLKDKDGNFVRSGEGGFSNPGEYWPDPGNPEWQAYFVQKVTKLLTDTGRQWDAVLLDQFPGTADFYENYAKGARQVTYPTDEAFQAAQLSFLKAARTGIGKPIIANMDGSAILRSPAFVGEVARAAGGAENEVFPEEMSPEELRPYLETVQGLPGDIHIRINSKPGGMAGNIDRTLFDYYCYLLIADRERQVHWTYKEGTSDIPHYWYREFDLNLGASQGNIDFSQPVWTRSFANAVVAVNPGQRTEEYRWEAGELYCDVTGKPLQSPVSLKSRTAMLLIKDPSILPK